jgi:gliding motility-associated-like protein
MVKSIFILIITWISQLHVANAQPLLLSVNQSNATCYGTLDGTINVTAQFGTGAYTYDWNHDLFYDLPSSNALAAGYYSITVSDGINTDSVSVILTQPAEVKLQARKENAGCGLANGSIQLLSNYADSVGAKYNWDFSSSYHQNKKDKLEAGVYSVWATYQSCVSETIEVTILDLPPPTIDVYDTLTINVGESITIYNTFFPSEHVSLRWSPEQGLSCTECIFPLATPEQSTNYICTIYDSLARCSRQDICKITVKTPEYFVLLPNTFTPNNDYRNDLFFVRGYGIKKITFQVFDKFGAMVFETTDPRVGWDGTFKSRPLDTDVFSYQVYGEYINDERFVKNGGVTLLR